MLSHTQVLCCKAVISPNLTSWTGVRLSFTWLGKPENPVVVTVTLEPVFYPQVMRDPIIWASQGKSSAAAGAEIKALMAIFGTICEKMILRPKGIILEIEVSHHAAVITFHLSA